MFCIHVFGRTHRIHRPYPRPTPRPPHPRQL